MSNVNPVAERALDMALRTQSGPMTSDEFLARAKAFEKYLSQERPTLDRYEEVLKAARLVAEEISAKAISSDNEQTLVEAARRVWGQP